MFDRESVRDRARRVRAEVTDPATRPAADALLAAALQRAGLEVVRVAPMYPGLRGARACLDLTVRAIFLDATLAPEMQRFAQAHELGHFQLHGDAQACGSHDIIETFTTGGDRVEGYDYRQHRETAANLFAAEFLLPAAEAQRQFLQERRSASQIAAASGLSVAATLNQLAACLLVNPGRAAGAEPGDPGRPVPGASNPATQPLAAHPSDDPTQARAIRLAEGPALIEAGPGTGKTRALVGRLTHLLQDREVPPGSILALTFSNRAAATMRARLSRVVPDQAGAITLGTFHAFGLELLRLYAARAGLPPIRRLLDDLDALLLLERALPELELCELANLSNPAVNLPQVLAAIGRAKNDLVDPGEFRARAQARAAAAGAEAEQRAAARELEIARVYAWYDEHTVRRGLLDFGDLVMRPARLLQSDAELRATLQAQYRHILVDEYQDVNHGMTVLLKELAGAGQGLWVVGDFHQSIYGFRGATPESLRRFEADYPGTRRVVLGRNYRSTPPVIALCSAVAAQLDAEPPAAPRWECVRAAVDQAGITLAVAADRTAEVAGVARTIESWRARGYGYRDQAVLCRTNSQANAMASGLERLGLPVLYIGDLLSRPEVHDLLAVLTLAAGDRGLGLVRLARLPEHAMSDADVDALLAAARRERSSWSGLGRAIERAELSPAGRHAAHELWALLDPRVRTADPWTLLAHYLFEHGGLVRRLWADAGVASGQKLLAIGQLLRTARHFGQRSARDPGPPRPRGFLDYVRRMIASGDAPNYLPEDAETIDAVRVLTVHASKGLEFPVVLIPYLARGQFAARSAADEPEERRLFFVAVSRARDALVLSRAERYSAARRSSPSPLLELLGDALRSGLVATVTWPGDAAGIEPGAARSPVSGDRGPAGPSIGPPPSRQADLSASDLDDYAICPRRFFYRKVRGLSPPPLEGEGYKRFWDCLRRALRDLDRAHRAGALPVTAREVEAVLDREWQAAGPVGHPHERLYHRVARQWTLATWERLRAAAPPTARARDDQVRLEIAGAPVTVSFDRLEDDPASGAVRATRYKSGRRNPKHAGELRVTLYREALRQLAGPGRPASLEIEYLATGETFAVPDAPDSAARDHDRLDAVMRSIQAGDFPPAPSPDRCATCPFLFICPG